MSHDLDIVEATIDPTMNATEKKIAALKIKILELVGDSVDVVHCAVKGINYRGNKITRTQLYAANPIVSKFAPMLEGGGSGEVHLHLNLPRPKQPMRVIDVKSKAVK